MHHWQLDGPDSHAASEDACVPSRDGIWTIYATHGGDGQGDSPEARGATGQMPVMAAFKLQDFRA